MPNRKASLVPTSASRPSDMRDSLLNNVNIMLGTRTLRRSTKNHRPKFLDAKNIRFDSNKENDLREDDALMGGNVISEMKDLLSVYGDNIKHTERFIESNNVTFRDTSKIVRVNELSLDTRKKQNNIGRLSRSSLPNILLSAKIGCNAKTTSIIPDKHLLKTKNFDFELIYDGRLVTINNFATGQKSLIMGLPQFFEKAETIYNKFCESKEKDVGVLTEIFKTIVNFDENAFKDKIERIFFVSKKQIRRSVNQSFFNSLMGQPNYSLNRRQKNSRFQKNIKDKIAVSNNASFNEDNHKLSSRGFNSRPIPSYIKGMSIVDFLSMGKLNPNLRQSDSGSKYQASNTHIQADTEYLHVIYFVVTKLTRYFFKTRFKSIQKIRNEILDVDTKIKDLSILKCQSNPFFNQNQTKRFYQVCEKVSELQKGNIYDLSRHSIGKSIIKYSYNATDNGFAYLKNLKRFVQRDS
jgi:hypothetical protein